jgi:hypothetical protein
MAVLKGTMWLVIKITRNIITVTMMNIIDMLKTIKTATTKKKHDCASDEDDDRHYVADVEDCTEETNHYCF